MGGQIDPPPQRILVVSTPAGIGLKQLNVFLFLATCCSNILLDSTSQATIDGFSFLGKYIPYAAQPEFNGKKVYAKEDDTRYCLRTPTAGGNWVLAFCSDLTTTSG